MASSSSSTSKSYPSLVPRGANEGKPSIALSRPVWVIGSRKGCHLHLISSQISQAHCVIVNTGHGLFVKDLASRTHTYVNKHAVAEAVLQDGDKFQIGTFKFFFKDPAAKKGDSVPEAPPAILRIAGETMHLSLTSKAMLIGRKPNCDVPLDQESVSQTHALIFDIGGEHHVRDLGSRTGTFLNGQKIHQEELNYGDVIKIGDTEFTYEAAPAVAEESAAPAEAEASDSDAPLAMETDELISVAPSLDEPEVSATATPIAEPELLAVEEEESVPVSHTDEVPAPGEPTVEAEPSAADAIDLEPLPLDLDILSEPADEPVLDDEAPQSSSAVVEAPAGMTSDIKLPGADDLLDLNEHAEESHPADPEDTAFHVDHVAEPEAEPATPAAEPVIEAPVSVRRGWRASFAEPSPVLPTLPPTAPVETAPSEPVSIPPEANKPDTISHDVVDVLDLAPTDDSPAETVAESAGSPDEVAPLAGASDDPVVSLPEAAVQDEVTAGELELSDVQAGSGEIDLESADVALSEPENAAEEDAFAGVNIEELAVDALAEVDDQHESPPPAPAPLTEADVATPLDLSPLADEPAPAVSATSDVSAPAELPLDLSVPIDEPMSTEVSATSDEPLPVDELPLPEPSATPEEIPEAPRPEDIAPLPLPEPEQVFKDEEPAAPAPSSKKTKPATGRGRKKKAAVEEPVAPLPPVIDLTPDQLKPSKGRRGKLPAKGRRGKESPTVAESTPSVVSPVAGASLDQPAEVIEPTEPTPESALNLDSVVPIEETPAADTAPTEKLSDSVFGRAVEEMAGPSLGDLVEPEPRAMSPFEQIVSEASSFVAHETPTADTANDDAFDAMIADEIAAEEAQEVPQVTEPEPESADTTEPVAEDSIEPEPEPVAEEEPLQISIDPPMMDAPEEPAPEPGAVEPAELSLEAELPVAEELSEDSVAPLVFDEPTQSLAGTITLGEVSATATETIDSLPAMDEIEATSNIAPDDELVTPEAAAAASEPAIESLLLEPAVEGEDTLAEADVEPLDLTTEPMEQVIPTAPASPELSLPSELTLDEPDEQPSAQPIGVVPPPSPIAPQGFFGISRDAEAFIGGMPLTLPELAPPPPTFGRVAVRFNDTSRTVSHAAPPPPPLIIGDDEDESPSESAESQPADGLPSEDDGLVAATPTLEFPDTESPEPLPALAPEPESPVAQTPAAPGKVLTGVDLPAPKIENLRPTPPRPRRNRLADYEKRFADVAEDAALQEMLRSKPAETKPRQQVAPSGFDGLAISSPVREADVFSAGTGNESGFLSETPRANDPFFEEKDPAMEEAASRTVAHGHVPPGSKPNVPLDFGDTNLTSDAFPDIPLAARSSDPFGMSAKLRSSSSPIAAPDFRYTGSGHGQRRIGIKVMLVAMVVFMVLAGAGGWLLTPVTSTLRAKATFTNLSQRSMFDRVKFQSEQEAVINNPVVRTHAVELFKQTSPQTDPGILSDALAFERMTRKLDWPEKSNNVIIELNSVDSNNDQRRLSALLAAIYSENKSLTELAAQRKKEFELAQQFTDELIAQKNTLLAKIRVLNNSDERPSASLIADTEKQAGLLSDVWVNAVKTVNDLKDQLARLKPSESEAAHPAPAAGVDPEKDAIVLQMREELKSLQDKILAARPQDAEALGKARKALDDALDRFQEQLTLTQNGAGNSAELASFISAARKLQTLAKQLNSDLIDRQRAQNEKLQDMKRRLDDQIKSRRDALYAGDATLKELDDKLSFARRAHNVAIAEGLEAEALRYQIEIDKLTSSADARKTELGKDVALEGTTAEIQKLIDDNTKSILTDQQLFQVQMSEVTAALNAAAPGLSKLAPEQKKLAEELSKRTADLWDARRTYMAMANATAPQANDDVRKLEADTQLLSQRINQRVAELKDADTNQRNQNDLDRAARVRKYEEAQSQLAIAEKSETDARTTWLAKQTELSGLRAKLNAARADDQALEEYHRQQQVLEGRINEAQKKLDAQRLQGTASILPEPPAEDAVIIAAYHDPRWKYALVCTMAVVGLFTFLILLGGFHHTPSPAMNRPKVESIDPATKDSEDESDTPVAV